MTLQAPRVTVFPRTLNRKVSTLTQKVPPLRVATLGASGSASQDTPSASRDGFSVGVEQKSLGVEGWGYQRCVRHRIAGHSRRSRDGFEQNGGRGHSLLRGR